MQNHSCSWPNLSGLGSKIMQRWGAGGRHQVKRDKEKQRVLIMAGGTGGHVFPALVVAEYLREQGVKVSWLGTRCGLEAKWVSNAGFPIDYISVKGLRGKGVTSWLLAPYKLWVAFWQAWAVCKKRQPHMVLGMGGYVTGPGGLAAWVLRKPLVIHEQNARPGLTNRLLSRFARQVLEAFPGSFASPIKALHTGNPVRRTISQLPDPKERFAARQDAIRLLVIGGSLGAQVLNQCVPQAVAMLAPENRPQVWHQTGDQKLVSTRRHYEREGIKVKLQEFIENMAQALSWADLVVCRAGALTVTELTVVGVGAILVPYPYAVDDHQSCNAAYLADVGAAKVVQQRDFTAERLASLLFEFISNGRERLLQMAMRAKTLAKPDAAHQVAQVCLEVTHV